MSDLPVGPPPLQIRHAEASDYDAIAAVVDDWWDGRPMRAMLPRLFFQHFRPTSFVAERDGRVVGFVVAFVSQTDPASAYIHFVGVAPEERGRGIGEALYRRVFDVAATAGCRTVHAITSPLNIGSIAFHRRLGFAPAAGPAATAAGIPYAQDYDGPGEDRVRLARTLPEPGKDGSNGY